MPKYTKGVSGNPAGRPPGSTNKVPSNKEILDSLKRCNKAAINKLLSLLEAKSEETQLKAAVKIVDLNYQVAVEEEKRKHSEKFPKKSSNAVEVEVEDNKSGAKVMRIRR